MKLVHNFSKSP